MTEPREKKLDFLDVSMFDAVNLNAERAKKEKEKHVQDGVALACMLVALVAVVACGIFLT